MKRLCHHANRGTTLVSLGQPCRLAKHVGAGDDPTMSGRTLVAKHPHAWNHYKLIRNAKDIADFGLTAFSVRSDAEVDDFFLELILEQNPCFS